MIKVMQLITKKILPLLIAVCWSSISTVAQDVDSVENERLARMITLTDVVMSKEFNVPNFIKRVKEDTTFYKAFKNLRILNFSSLNSISMTDMSGNKLKASLNSRTRQVITNRCRLTHIEEEKVTGDFYTKNGEYNYYTAELYASLFFARTPICGEDNIVKGSTINPRNKSGMDKRKEQLKMLFFNPGKKITGIPFMGDKSNIFDPDIAAYYDMQVDAATYDGKDCYIFSITAKEDLTGSQRDKIVFDNMTTWFAAGSYEILARNYALSYNAGAYRFNVAMEVKLGWFGKLQVPTLLRYNGNWNVVFKAKEKGFFTATLYDFRN
jgi:hypothetical protein